MRYFDDRWTPENIARWLRQKASVAKVFNGEATRENQLLLDSLTVGHSTTGTLLILSRECGYHSSGWWKNPDYERCWHMSLSFRDPQTGQPRSKDKVFSKIWIDAVFGQLQTLIWTEPPHHKEGKANDVWHYRVFYTPNWADPIKPRKEVYSRDFTPAGFLSWSDLRALEAAEEKVLIANQA